MSAKLGPIIAIIIAVVLVGGWWYFTPESEAPLQAPATTNTHTGTTYSVEYPSDYALDRSYSRDIAPGRRSVGVSFGVPLRLTEGTNLSQDSYISVESVPELSSCYAAQYLFPMPVSGGPNVTDAEVEYSFATSSGAGAGNFYEETVYVRQDAGPCIAIHYFIHSTNIGNYDPGAVREFDRATLMKEFDQIRRSVKRI